LRLIAIQRVLEAVPGLKKPDARIALLLLLLLAPACLPGFACKENKKPPAVDSFFQLPSPVALDRRYDDQARFLAGLKGRPGSPLRARENDPVWQEHADQLNQAWERINQERFNPLQNWAREQLQGTGESQVVLYPFSGPDTPSVFSIYPDRSYYILAGLERPGSHINLAELKESEQRQALFHIQKALSDLLVRSYFITSHMLEQLQSGSAEGAVPVMNLFLARQGYYIKNVFDLSIQNDGSLQQRPFGSSRPDRSIQLVRIAISPENDPGRNISVLYLRANLVDAVAQKAENLQNFLLRIPDSHCFLKSAAYMLHATEFDHLRNRVMESCKVILQDDSGIAVRFFSPERWQVKVFGTYKKPIRDFGNWTYQPDLALLYAKNKPASLPFNMGYHWEAGAQNMQLAIRR
jgi:hypothetical protein